MVRGQWIRVAWIVAAGACIALGAGSGVAGATPDSNGPSKKDSSQSAGASGSNAARPAKTSAKKQDSDNGPRGLQGSRKPRGAVNGSTASGGRDAKDETRADGSAAQATPGTSTDDPAAASKPSANTRPVAGRRDGRDQKSTSGSSVPTTSSTSTDKLDASTSPVQHKPSSMAAGAPHDPSATLQRATMDASDGKAESLGSAERNAVGQKSLPATVVTEGDNGTDTAKGSEPKALVAAPQALVAQAAPAASVARSAPAEPGGLVGLALNLLSTFGLLPAGSAAPATIAPRNGTSSSPGVVTGVVVGRAPIDIPVGTATYTGAADWYFPTQADGTVAAKGVTYLAPGFLGDKSWYSALATQLAQRTDNVVVVTNVPSFPFFTCSGCTVNGVPMAQGVADLFADPNRTALNASATAAGFQGTLPTAFVLTGHSAGGGLATAAAGFYEDAVPADENDLLGVVMYDGFSSNGTFADAITTLDSRNIPVYQIAAPPQPWNGNGQTTADLVALRPGQFVGDTLAYGSHVDSLIGGEPLIDAISQAFIKPSPPGNTDAVYTLASGWINDLYAGRGPSDPLYGIYGAPKDYVILGPASAVVLGATPVVDVNRYLGTWYEVGSVKQFFSLGLVNTTATYTSNPDGSIAVDNSGNYFVSNGPLSQILGTAVPLNADDTKLNVTFFGPPSAAQPGNYWIVDHAPDYGWAIVTDPTFTSAFLLSRTPIVSTALYQELLARASAAGITGPITATPQPAASSSSIAV